MPELPEVETTRRGLLPHVVGRRVDGVVVRDARLRWPVPADLGARLTGERFTGLRRRGKYLVFDCAHGHLLVHLGMSGRLSLVPDGTPARRHDHVDVKLEGRTTLRLTDPRRFGACLWLEGDAEQHELLRHLGLEPLEAAFDGAALHRLSRGRATAIKHFLMDARIVTGVGNIYASEALFHAGIHPARAAGRIARARYDRLAEAVRTTLERALAAGGTTLRDFAAVDGSLGHFQLETAVYGREGEPCRKCRTPIRQLRQGQRSTYYCPRCQR
ncbi:MAG TPA: bifunctional DNA-formamidopyrimidine glycosylase/DNA-(apurinic or apyrimidinic site) lyase [Usitatibacter sp.]|jgi:formamidopyrimidine-DNA glycosylase|nr:bifunctional DNA-formamidopyrimidine glycosylase/DNA-(apurinic or apyrimidinic site) lyase [Usitatibacter sp.]